VRVTPGVWERFGRLILRGFPVDAINTPKAGGTLGARDKIGALKLRHRLALYQHFLSRFPNREIFPETTREELYSFGKLMLNGGEGESSMIGSR
jgi:hypothetical protein